VKKGVEQLQEAEKYQKNARPMKCMLLLMLLIIIMTIIIIVRKS
jgi:t-SNARE complex subunit (syntaxin)